MNDDATIIDQADEETLTTTVSDETLEAAAGTVKAGYTASVYCTFPGYGC